MSRLVIPRSQEEFKKLPVWRQAINKSTSIQIALLVVVICVAALVVFLLY